jgi:hypothetical protein
MSTPQPNRIRRRGPVVERASACYAGVLAGILASAPNEPKSAGNTRHRQLAPNEAKSRPPGFTRPYPADPPRQTNPKPGEHARRISPNEPKSARQASPRPVPDPPHQTNPIPRGARHTHSHRTNPNPPARHRPAPCRTLRTKRTQIRAEHAIRILTKRTQVPPPGIATPRAGPSAPNEPKSPAGYRPAPPRPIHPKRTQIRPRRHPGLH